MALGLVGGLADPFGGNAFDQADKTIRWGLLGLGNFEVNFAGPTQYPTMPKKKPDPTLTQPSVPSPES